ncbi:hypothetical protein BJF78_25545 [Pseudonocardia sp. CNS-139]|nr:hypothetical protein BJF78_25545 [Pseudonocardia sp. CNS-139]
MTPPGPAHAQVSEALARIGAASIGELAATTGLTGTDLWHALRLLRRRGEVHAERRDLVVRYVLAPLPRPGDPAGDRP